MEMTQEELIAAWGEETFWRFYKMAGKLRAQEWDKNCPDRQMTVDEAEPPIDLILAVRINHDKIA